MAPMSLGTQLAGLAPTPVRAATGARCQQRVSAVPTLRSATKVAASASGFDFTPEQQRAAMEKQLRLSAERAAAEEERKRQAAARGAAAAEAPSVIPKRKQPRRAARLAAAAAAAEVSVARGGHAERSVRAAGCLHGEQLHCRQSSRWLSARQLPAERPAPACAHVRRTARPRRSRALRRSSSWPRGLGILMSTPWPLRCVRSSSSRALLTRCAARLLGHVVVSMLFALVLAFFVGP